MSLCISYLLRRSLYLLIVCVAVGTSAQTARSLDAERALHEKLLDTAALVKAGISRADYRKLLPELVVLRDRFERNGGKNPLLGESVVAFQEADPAWEDLINYRIENPLNVDPPYPAFWVARIERGEQSRQDLVQSAWNRAVLALTKYAAEKAASDAKGNTRSRKK